MAVSWVPTRTGLIHAAAFVARKRDESAQRRDLWSASAHVAELSKTGAAISERYGGEKRP